MRCAHFSLMVACCLGVAALAGGCSRQAARAPEGSAAPPAASGSAAGPAAAEDTAPAAGAKGSKAPLVVQGEVLVVSKVPEPGSVPYTECLTYVKYRVARVESGDYGRPELLVAHWGMKANKRMLAAGLKVGETRRLTLEPLSDHPELERVMQADDTAAYDLTPYWAVEAE